MNTIPLQFSATHVKLQHLLTSFSDLGALKLCMLRINNSSANLQPPRRKNVLEIQEKCSDNSGLTCTHAVPHAHTLPDSIVAYSYSAHPLCQTPFLRVGHHSLLFSVCVPFPSPSQLSTPITHVFSTAHPSCSVSRLVVDLFYSTVGVDFSLLYRVPFLSLSLRFQSPNSPWTDWLPDRQLANKPRHTKRKEIIYTFVCLSSYTFVQVDLETGEDRSLVHKPMSIQYMCSWWRYNRYRHTHTDRTRIYVCVWLR